MKKYTIEWSNKARIDVMNHTAFLLNVSTEAAGCFVEKMKQSIKLLETMPQRFPIFEMTKTLANIEFRKCVVDGRYIVIYAVYSESVKIYRILDSRKKFETLID